MTFQNKSISPGFILYVTLKLSNSPFGSFQDTSSLVGLKIFTRNLLGDETRQKKVCMWLLYFEKLSKCNYRRDYFHWRRDFWVKRVRKIVSLPMEDTQNTFKAHVSHSPPFSLSSSMERAPLLRWGYDRSASKQPPSLLLIILIICWLLSAALRSSLFPFVSFGTPPCLFLCAQTPHFVSVRQLFKQVRGGQWKGVNETSF